MIVIGLGGNVGGEAAVRARFGRAREALAELGAVRSAGLYRTAAIGPEQPDYLNSAVGVRWEGAQPAEVIATVLELERGLGRERRGEARWGPRLIDLDVLWWAEPAVRSVRQPGFDVPHPRLAARRFALLPLIDVVGGEALLDGVTLAAHAARVHDQRVELIASSW